MSLKLSTAENLVRKTWTESSGKKITKHHYNSVIRKFYPSKYGLILKEYYFKLLPYLKRDIHLSKIVNESFIKEIHIIDISESEKMSILGKMIACCGHDRQVFENTYGKTYEEIRMTIK